MNSFQEHIKINFIYNNHTHHLCDFLHEFGAWIAEEDTLEFTIPNERHNWVLKVKKNRHLQTSKSLFLYHMLRKRIVYGERGKFNKWLFWHFNFNCCQRFEGV